MVSTRISWSRILLCHAEQLAWALIFPVLGLVKKSGSVKVHRSSPYFLKDGGPPAMDLRASRARYIIMVVVLCPNRPPIFASAVIEL